MGKQKQQVISRFFAPKPKPDPSIITDSPPSPPPSRENPTLPAKISATVSFSPSKRLQLSSPSGRPAKSSKLSHPRFTASTASSSRPSTTPRSLNDELSTSVSKKYTPLEKQVVEFKSKYKDVLLMIEVGYKYRFFGEDAEIAARVLGIYAHQDHNFITASIPTFRLHIHVRRLVNAGHKVGVVKQTETAAIKAHGSNPVGPFCRGLSALYTKATLEAAEEMGGIEEGIARENHYLVCVVEKSIDGVGKKVDCDVKIGFVAVEISTAEVLYGDFDDNSLRSELEALVLSLSPAELLITNKLSSPTEKLLLAYCGPASNIRVERVQWNYFDDGGALAEVLTLYESMIDQNSDFHMQGEAKELPNPYSAIEVINNMPNLAVQALALTIRHLKQFGFERILCLGASFRPFSANMEMSLSGNTLQQLEILRNNVDGSEAGSLLQLMNRTMTVYGSRLLRNWVAHPLCDRNMILARQDAVAEIAEYMRSGTTTSSNANHNFDGRDSDMETVHLPEISSLLSSALTILSKSIDIERGITRIFYRTATASEFIAVMEALLFAAKQLQRLYIMEGTTANENRLQPIPIQSLFLRKIIFSASSSSVIASAAKLLSTINKEAAAEGNLSNLIMNSNSQYPEVDRAQKAVQLAKDELDALIVLYRKQLGTQTLEFLTVSGSTHLIELPVDKKVPSEWVKVNGTKKTIRYHPPAVLTSLDQLALANEELMVACRAAWDNFLQGFRKYYTDFQAAVQALAALDCLHSLALLSRNKNYVRPHFVKDGDPIQLQISCGRHPVLETILEDNFVPNDTILHADGEICQIVTGPNMGGKSCYIRQVALIAIMAQVGSFVPASSAKLHVLDGIYTRMGASDSIQRGRSTFLEELSEASQILRKSTSCSLVIMDELGRGTSTHDGLSIAYATLHHLLEKKCMTLFVTHYPKIAEVQLEFPTSVGAYHVSYLTSVSTSNPDGDVTYLYKLRSGISERSFGFNVAELAQVPSACVHRAAVMASKLESAVRSRARDRFIMDGRTEKQSANYPFGGSDEDFEELISCFRRLFSMVKSALGGSDVEKSFQSLLHARHLVLESG